MYGNVIHMQWMKQAACVGESETFAEQDNFRAEPSSREAVERASRAIAICSSCPVLEDCTQWVFAEVQDPAEGMVTAGLLTRDRRALRRNAGRYHPTTNVERSREQRMLLAWYQLRSDEESAARQVADQFGITRGTLYRNLRQLERVENSGDEISHALIEQQRHVRAQKVLLRTGGKAED